MLDDAGRTNIESRVDWAPDGTLYYLSDEALYRARVGDDPADNELIRRFDDAGVLSRQAVSPDGTRIALEIDTGKSTID